MMSFAIPTRYHGVNFRSRLEARWAAFFDMVGWRWDFEPIDMNGYIPDFILTGPKGSLIVEIKPSPESRDEAAKKYLAAGGTKELAILYGMWEPHELNPEDCLSPGVLLSFYNELDEDSEHGRTTSNFDPISIGYSDQRDLYPDIGACYGDYAGRLYGNYDGNPLVYKAPKYVHPSRASDYDWFDEKLCLEATWKEAGNMVQWKRR